MRISDRARHHAGDGILVLPDDPDDLEFQPVVVQCLESKVLFAEIDIFLLRLVILVHIGREDIAKAHLADILIAPAFDFGFHCLLRDKGLHVVGDRSCRLQPQRIKHEVRNLIILIDDQDRLVIALRPFAVKNIILVFQKGVNVFPVFSREHLLPNVDHGIIRAIGGKKRTVISAVHAAHRCLHELHDVRLCDVPVHILSV